MRADAARKWADLAARLEPLGRRLVEDRGDPRCSLGFGCRSCCGIGCLARSGRCGTGSSVAPGFCRRRYRAWFVFRRFLSFDLPPCPFNESEPLMSSYNVRSPRADEFINHEEIFDTLAYAEAHKNDAALARSILEKARANLTPAHDHGTTLTHREASVLLACEDPEVNAEIRQLARDIKQAYYGNRIVLFAPLYLSNYCVNGCLYCPYHAKNRDIPRRKLTQEEIRAEVVALQDMGHKRLAIEAGEDPIHNPLDYILESLETIYGTKHKNGAIRRVNVNIAATTEDAYRQLKAAEIGTYILFQETYHRARYEEPAPLGPKATTPGHTEAHDRAMAAGIDDVGLGVLFGLEAYATSSPACSCTRSIWKRCSAWARTPSRCRG